jgi:hypothetical protein
MEIIETILMIFGIMFFIALISMMFNDDNYGDYP